MNLLDSLYIDENDLATHDDRILLTVSGGVDSMVMLSLFTRCGYRVGVAHCNFQLRGAESDEDEVLVEDEAKKHGAAFYNKRFETRAEMERTGESMEMAARRLRYAWFDALSREHGYTAIAIAHHADDSIETFFINLLRGTGLRGLTGISTQVGKVIRPLLFASRKEILEYAVQNRIPFREDSSNRSTKYLRNKIRLGLIPRIREINPKFTSLMSRNLARLTDAQLFINHGIERIRSEAVTSDTGIDTIHLDRLDPAFPQGFVIYELLSSGYGFKGDVIDALCHSLEQDATGRRFYAASDEPDDLVARQQHELPLLLGHGDLGVDEEVRHLFAARHAERHEPVAVAPAAQRERELQAVGVYLRDVLGNAEILDRVDVAVFVVEDRVAAVAARGVARRTPHRRPLPPYARHGKRVAHHQRNRLKWQRAL